MGHNQYGVLASQVNESATEYAPEGNRLSG